MFEILDAVIATAAVTLALALVVQAVQQIIKQFFDLKSSYMRVELLALFSDDDKVSFSLPSWLINFLPLGRLGVKADETAKRLVRELEERMSTFGLSDLHLLQDVDPEKLKEIVGSLPIAHDTSVREQFEKAFARIELWIDISKKAFQEHYERRMRAWSLVLGAAAVVALNANVIDIYQEFSHSKPLRETAIALGQRLVSIPKDSLILPAKTASSDTSLAVAMPDSNKIKEIKRQLAIIQSILDEESFQVMGWSEARLAKYRRRPFLLNALLMLAGWLGMTLLVSLGTPFWYDFLKTVFSLKEKLKGVPRAGAAPPPANQVTGTSPDIPPVG